MQEKEKLLQENKKYFRPPSPASFSPLQVVMALQMNKLIDIIIYMRNMRSLIAFFLFRILA